jgi:hypothetical protein
MTTWRAYLGITAIAALAYSFAPASSQSLLYDAIAISAVVAMFAGIRIHDPVPRAAWLLLALGVAALVLGDLVYGSSQPVPSIADAIYISGYPLLGLGLFGLVPWISSRRRDPNLAVALAAAVIVAAIAWAFLLLPASDPDEITLGTRAIAIGYPLLDLVLLALFARSCHSWRLQGAHEQLLGTALLLMFIADVGFAIQGYGTGYSLGSALDTIWLLQYACFGAALLHPSVATWFAPSRATPPASGGATLVAVRVGTQGLRFEVVATITGTALLALAATTIVLAATWLAGDVVFLAAAYGLTGFLMLVGGLARAGL